MRALPPPRHVKAEGVESKEISAQVQMSRGTLPSLSQTGEGFLLTFDLGPQQVLEEENGKGP